MKRWQLGLAAAVTLGFCVVAQSAPVPSQPSHVTSARQQVEDVLAQQAVRAHLESLGLARMQVEQRLAVMSAEEMVALAQQLNRIQIGGTIQGGNPRPLGVLGCIFQPVGRFFYNLFQLIFCWGPLDID